jgi:hypothetical protein
MLSVSPLSRKGFLIADQLYALPKADEISMYQLVKAQSVHASGLRPNNSQLGA